MRRKSFEGVPCGIARAVDILSDAWTVVLIREAMFGVRSFDDFVKRLGIPRNTLTKKLEDMIEAGLMSKSVDPEDRRRSVYRLEAPGQDLLVVMLALQQWGNKWQFGDAGPPSLMASKDTLQPVDELTIRDGRGKDLTLQDVTMIPGPSATPDLIERFRQLL